MKNFEEWYKSFYGDSKYNSDTYYASKTAWDGCKEKVLKILNRRNNGNINDLPEDRIKEIEKL